MSFLDSLLGGGQQRQEYDDFVQRYDRGAPWDGITDDEAVNRYQQVAPQIPHDVYQQSAYDAFSRLDPNQRMELGRYLQSQVRQQGLPFQDLNRDGIDDQLQDPRYLAQVAGQMHQQQPGLLGQLLGGSMGGGMGGGLGSMLGGSGGMMGRSGGIMGGGGGMLASPIAKAALGGIAAMAVKRMMSGR